MNSNDQNPVNKFVKALIEGERATYNNIIRSAKFPASVFERYSSWCDDSYTRNCIADNDKFEIILLCWQPGQITPIHDHGGEECWVKIIEGEFKETIYKPNQEGKLEQVRSIVAKQNDNTYMKDFMGFHSLENLSDKRSMSLHIYAKPIRTCQLYDAKSETFSNKVMVYDTVSQ